MFDLLSLEISRTARMCRGFDPSVGLCEPGMLVLSLCVLGLNISEILQHKD